MKFNYMKSNFLKFIFMKFNVEIRNKIPSEYAVGTAVILDFVSKQVYGPSYIISCSVEFAYSEISLALTKYLIP